MSLCALRISRPPTADRIDEIDLNPIKAGQNGCVIVDALIVTPAPFRKGSMAEPQFLYEADGKVGIVTLNRPNKLNALSMELRLEMERVLREADDSRTPA